MRTIKEKTRNFVILFFSLILTLAVFSQLKLNAFNPKPVYEVGFGGQGWFYSKADKGISAYLGKKGSNVPTVRYQKDDHFLEFSMNQVSSTTAVSLETNSKEPNTPTLFYRNIAEDIDAAYKITNLPFGVKEEIVLKKFPISNFQFPMNDLIFNDSISKQIQFLFNSNTNTIPVKQPDGSIYFYDNQNNYLFQIDKPFMIDGSGQRSEDIGIDIIPKDSKGYQVNKRSNFEFRNSNFESILNTSIFKKVTSIFSLYKTKDLPVNKQGSVLFQNSKFKNSFKILNSKLEINPSQSYQLTLSASSDWLNDPSRVYPVIIDPTITHDESAEFNGQYNRIANASTTAVQLESSYPEATLDPYTVLLLHFNEANGSTSGIKDYASTTRVITANGNASTTSYVTQLGLGNSASFDGTGDYLSVPDSDDWDFGTGAWTVDMWIRTNTLKDQSVFANDSWANGFAIGLAESATPDGLDVTIKGTTLRVNWVPSVNKWYHLAIVRSGNNLHYFIDGSEISGSPKDVTGKDLTGLTNGLFVGSRAATEQNFDGNLDSVRILKGRALTTEEIKAAASRRPNAVYTSPVLDASASVQWDTLNWTEGGVKTGDGETLYNSSGLVAQWNFNETSGTTADNAEGTAALDGTLNGFSYTASQDQATTTTGWTANNKKWGAGSLMFDGSNDYVSVGDNDGWNFGSGDFSIETWVNFSAISSRNGIIGQYVDATHYWYLRANFTDSEGLGFEDYNGAAATVSFAQMSNSGWSPGVWYHIALVKNVSSFNIYRNGISIASVTDSDSLTDHAANVNIGLHGTTNYLNGILDSLRVYKGRALSASEILSNYNAGNIEIQTRTGATSDPNDGTWEAWKPTTGETQLLSMDSDKANWNAPEQIDGYTKLLLHMDGTDAATSFPNSATTTHTITANGNAQVDTAYSKFGGGSALFDGTGDYLTVPDSDDWNFGTGNFTIDTWVRFNAIGGEQNFFGQTIDPYDGNSTYQFRKDITTNKLRMFFKNGGVTKGDYIMSNNWSPSAGNWYHITFVRNGTTGLMFIDGVSQVLTETTTFGTNDVGDLAGTVYIASEQGGTGGYLNGSLDELRISKGIARWTSNFTPPPRAYGSNVKAENETTIKQEGSGSTKLTLGAPQVDGNTVALWHMEETGTTTGTYLYDETANNNDATTTGTTIVDGIFGKARKFNGTSDKVSNNPPASLPSGANARTIEAWAKADSFGGGNTYIYSYGHNSCQGSDTFALGVTSAGKAYFAGCVDDITGNATLSTNQWYHFATTYDGTTVKMYVNGVLDNSAAKTLNTTVISSYIGAFTGGTSYFNGVIDEVRVLNRVLSPDEIAETYRMGANHHLTRQVSSTDLSAQTKLPFWIAADRTGTFLEAMIGESDFANYELASSTLALSTTTVLYIKGDEIASSTSIKDSSFSGKTITANGNARTAGGGKIGNAITFGGSSSDYFYTDTFSDFNLGATGIYTIDFWMYPISYAASLPRILALKNSTVVACGGSYGGIYSVTASSKVAIGFLGSNELQSSTAISTGKWSHITFTRDGTNTKIYINGVVDALSTIEPMPNGNSRVEIGASTDTCATVYHNGNLDELRIIKGIALTADQIRQAYEYGLRSHPITIDFGATLQPSDLISNSTDYNFSLTATTSGLSATTSGLYLGDKIIIKENLGGTEYTAQGTVNAINTSTGAVTVPSWDSGSTFPSGNGYSPAATVFKWQREYFDITGAATTTRDAVTNLTIRPTNGAGGRTVYLDDFRYNTNYLTASSSSTITSSNNRYLQSRTIFTSTDTYVSPFISAFNTLYTSLANSFPSLIGISGGGFMSF